jgi:hypothetical protein
MMMTSGEQLAGLLKVSPATIERAGWQFAGEAPASEPVAVAAAAPVPVAAAAPAGSDWQAMAAAGIAAGRACWEVASALLDAGYSVADAAGMPRRSKAEESAAYRRALRGATGARLAKVNTTHALALAARRARKAA